MKKQLLPMGLALVMVACKPEGRVYDEHQPLSAKLEWVKSDTRTFKVPVQDAATAYDLSLSFRYATGYPYPTAMVKVTEISPSGVESTNEYELTVRDSDGEYLGEAGLDIWDSEHLVQAGKKYEETGEYTYIIEQNTPVDPLTHVMEVGVILDKAK